jgi:hypothetical protein
MLSGRGDPWGRMAVSLVIDVDGRACANPGTWARPRTERAARGIARPREIIKQDVVTGETMAHRAKPDVADEEGTDDAARRRRVRRCAPVDPLVGGE